MFFVRVFLVASVTMLNLPLALGKVRDALQARFENSQVIVEKVRATSARRIIKTACEVDNETAYGKTYHCAVKENSNSKIVVTWYRSRGLGSVVTYVPEINRGKMRAFGCGAQPESTDENPKLLCTRAGSRSLPGRSGLVSPFPSEVTGLKLPNAAWLKEPAHARDGGLMRGMNPETPEDFTRFADLGISRVLVFKDFRDDTSRQYERELTGLKSIGVENSAGQEDIKNILFPYHGFPSYVDACRMTIEGLRFIKTEIAASERVLLHCTVGEDRTGYLSGLYAMLQDPERSVEDVFHQYMCEFGYSSGNPYKPRNVTGNIDRDLTPLFYFMATRVRAGEINWHDLSDETCATADAEVTRYRGKPEVRALRCKMSSRFYP